MAASLYLVSKDDGDNPNVKIIDGITHVIVNDDDGQTDAQIIATVEATAITAGIPLPSPYFNLVEQISTSALLDTDGDAIFIRPLGDIRSIT